MISSNRLSCFVLIMSPIVNNKNASPTTSRKAKPTRVWLTAPFHFKLQRSVKIAVAVRLMSLRATMQTLKLYNIVPPPRWLAVNWYHCHHYCCCCIPKNQFMQLNWCLCVPLDRRALNLCCCDIDDAGGCKLFPGRLWFNWAYCILLLYSNSNTCIHNGWPCFNLITPFPSWRRGQMIWLEPKFSPTARYFEHT